MSLHASIRYGKDNNKSRPVIDTETGIIYETIRSLANTLDINQFTLRYRILKNLTNRYKFYIPDDKKEEG